VKSTSVAIRHIRRIRRNPLFAEIRALKKAAENDGVYYDRNAPPVPVASPGAKGKANSKMILEPDLDRSPRQSNPRQGELSRQSSFSAYDLMKLKYVSILVLPWFALVW
jgi:uncharacterized protein YggU (UPF0235/DUF167 family)